jgi:hypothetical protein
MLRSLRKLAAFVALLSFALCVTRQDAFGQESKRAGRSAPSGRSSALPPPIKVFVSQDASMQGSDPYLETLRRYLQNVEPKIVGGKQAPDGAFPWQVSLGVASAGRRGQLGVRLRAPEKSRGLLARRQFRPVDSSLCIGLSRL